MVAPEVEPVPVPWTAPALREVVDLQVERDGTALRARLDSDDADVRARAALALASVQDPAAYADLASLLGDVDPAVRREAAFALGQLDLEGRSGPLVDALAAEEAGPVRVRLVEALGKAGGDENAEVLAAHVARGAAEETALALALSRLALRGVRPPGLLDALVERLTHDDPQVRLMAAYYFGRSGDPAPWASRVGELRGALDGYGPGDPAAKHLLLALAAHGAAADRERIARRLTGPDDWRIRAGAARSLGAMPFVEAEGVRDALFERVESDPSVHVAVAAATAITGGPAVPPEIRQRMRSWILEGPTDRWHTHVPFLATLAADSDVEAILAWLRRMEDVHPTALGHGIAAFTSLGGEVLGGEEALGGEESPEAEEVLETLERLADHDDPHVRARAFAALGAGWSRMSRDEDYPSALLERGEHALERGNPAEVRAALGVMTSPDLLGRGSADRILEAFEHVDSTAPTPVLIAYLRALGELGGEEARPLVEAHLEHPQPRVRAAAGRAWELLTGRSVPGTALPDPERTIDWAVVEALGPSPRLHLETERGEIVVRLSATLAPLTVQALAELADAGAYDDTPFHRVLPDFVIQGGDVAVGDGTGSPGYAIRSELTPIPFRRGVIGMASSGKDTEGSQFFLTHSMQPHLDGGYTAFGWVEEGEAVLDAVLEGDRLLRARVVPDGAG